jgi:hypothetical protein
VFVKTDFQNRGANLGGIVWEEDPVRHRAVARKLAPAFSTKTTRALEPIVHKYVDYFIARMSDIGVAGVPLCQWTQWLAWDLSADIAWGDEVHSMRDGKRTCRLLKI